MNFVINKKIVILSIFISLSNLAVAQTATQISFIRWISPTECVQMSDIAQKLVFEKSPTPFDFYGSPIKGVRTQTVKSAISMLCASSNGIFPPQPLNNREFKKYMLKKQHRGVLQVGEGRLSCNDQGEIVSYSPGRVFDHPGFTPITFRSSIGERTVFYEKAERGVLDDSFRREDACIVRTVKARSRVSQFPGGVVSRVSLLHFPPWISRTIEYRQCCNMPNSVKFYGSHFPSHQSYFGSSLVGGANQSGFQKFLMTSGGTDAESIRIKKR